MLCFCCHLVLIKTPRIDVDPAVLFDFLFPFLTSLVVLEELQHFSADQKTMWGIILICIKILLYQSFLQKLATLRMSDWSGSHLCATANSITCIIRSNTIKCGTYFLRLQMESAELKILIFQVDLRFPTWNHTVDLQIPFIHCKRWNIPISISWNYNHTIAARKPLAVMYRV